MSIITKLEEVNAKLDNGKTLIASAISNKGISTAKTDTLETMANKISQIQSGGGLEPGTKIPFSKLQMPEEETILSGVSTLRFCVDIGEKIIASLYPTVGYYLYCFDKTTKKEQRILSSYYYFDSCLVDNDKLIFTASATTSQAQKRVIITDFNFSVLATIKVPDYYSNINSGTCGVKIIKNGDYYYVLYAHNTNNYNFILKINANDYTCTVKSINEITSNTNSYYNCMEIYNDKIYILGYKDLIRTNLDLELEEISTTVCSNTTSRYYYQMFIKNDYLYVKKLSSYLYKVNLLDFSDYSTSFDDSSYIYRGYSDGLFYGKKYLYSINSGNIRIFDFSDSLKYLKTIRFDSTVLFFYEFDNYIIFQDSDRMIYLYNADTLELIWNFIFSGEYIGYSDFSFGVDLINLHQLAYIIDDEIYLFRKGITKIPLNLTFAVK